MHEDEIGKVFGHLTVLGIKETRKGSFKFECHCDCGNDVELPRGKVVRRQAGTCGHCKRNDYVGEKHGMLTILESHVHSHGGFFICKCDCGKEVRLKQSEVLTPNKHQKTDCGCKLENWNTSNNSYVGKRIGRLLVLSYTACGTGGSFQCQCDCGKLITLYGHQIANNNRLSCGCVRDTLVGQIFGRLTVVEDSKENNRTKLKCMCDCGVIKDYNISQVTTGQTKSCGCLRKEIQSKIHWKGCGELSGGYFSKFRCAARNRGREFSITIEFMWELFLKQDRKCALSGVDIYFINGRDNRKSGTSTASIDRIDSSKDYTEDNVQWVHKDINFMKQELTDEKFINWCHSVSEYQLSKTNLDESLQYLP